MSTKIMAQEEEIRKQVILYAEQTQKKTEEETELTKVLADYKKKYDEFAKAMKKSRETFKVYEGEIKSMNQRANDLAQTKRQLTQGVSSGAGKKKGKGAAQQAPYDSEKREAEIEKLQSEWAAEKEALAKEKEELVLTCKELQDKIKALKEAA